MRDGSRCLICPNGHCVADCFDIVLEALLAEDLAEIQAEDSDEAEVSS